MTAWPPAATLSGPEPPLDLGDTGRDLYAHTEPIAYADPEFDWPWARFMAALAELLDPVSVMVRDDDQGNEGWTHLASPVRCPTPWLRVLAQWAGIRRWDAMTEEDLRALIGPHAPGMWRGTVAAITAAIARFLPDGSETIVEERVGGDAYLLRIVTLVAGAGTVALRLTPAGQIATTPSGFNLGGLPFDALAVWGALSLAKPAGLILEYAIRPQ